MREKKFNFKISTNLLTGNDTLRGNEIQFTTKISDVSTYSVHALVRNESRKIPNVEFRKLSSLNASISASSSVTVSKGSTRILKPEKLIKKSLHFRYISRGNCLKVEYYFSFLSFKRYSIETKTSSILTVCRGNCLKVQY